ncbi:hypothetical protein [Nostoc sp.]
MSLNNYFGVARRRHRYSLKRNDQTSGEKECRDLAVLSLYKGSG